MSGYCVGLNILRMPHYFTELVFPYGVPAIKGVLKQSLDDFRVYEELGFEPSGAGEHLYLFIEKKDMTTDSMIQHLARHYAVKPYHIGDCGLKDAKAVTRQWFSVHLPGLKIFPEDPVGDDFLVLKRHWSLKKLKKGVHKGNTFSITLRGVEGDIATAEQQLAQITQFGFANYFGEQRFGRGQRNVANAMDALMNNKKLSRAKKSLYLSSLRSFLFNKVLCLRVQQQHWQAPVEGDCFMLNGTRSIFCATLTDSLLQRYVEGDIHAFISLEGEGESLVSGMALDYEQEVVAQHGDILRVLVEQGLKKDKRAIRQMLEYLEYQFSAGTLNLRFFLPKGCYATTLIQHFCVYSS